MRELSSVLLCALAACSPSAPPRPIPPDNTAQIAQATALLPEAMRSEIAFGRAVNQDAVIGAAYVAVIPAGREWLHQPRTGTWQWCSSDPASAGSCRGRAPIALLTIQYSCDGGCTPKSLAEWQRIADRTFDQGFSVSSSSPELARAFRVDREVALPHGRLREATDPLLGDRHVIAVMIDDRASIFYTCSVRLDASVAAAAPAFSSACASLMPLTWQPQEP